MVKPKVRRKNLATNGRTFIIFTSQKSLLKWSRSGEPTLLCCWNHGRLLIVREMGPLPLTPYQGGLSVAHVKTGGKKM